jgi:thioredoxin-like negative regulator of GroEL
MKISNTIRAGLMLAGVCLAAQAATAFGQTTLSAEQSLAAGRAALRQKHYPQAIHVLENGLNRFPRDTRLRVELGRAYLYDHQDDRAMQVFREVLREDSSNRPAKLELARALSYRHEYDASNQLYRELLASNAGDEAASVGVVRNLVHQKRTPEARQELDRALASHPNSPTLAKYKAYLQRARVGGSEVERPPGRVQGGADYFSDSAGNRAWQGSQQFDYNIGRSFSNRLGFEERSLWRTATPKANVLSGMDEARLQVLPMLQVGTGGGLVHFADGKGRGLYRGEVELHPARRLWWDVDFSRNPVVPTFSAAQFDLLAEGWHSRLDWRPGPWRLNANFSRQHYSDGNRRQREGGEVMRWLRVSRLEFGTGYRIIYFTFKEHVLHGYFNPLQYQSHMGLMGVRFRVGKAFRGEYVARAGAESFSPADLTTRGPFRLAGELALRNHVVVGNWEVGIDYNYWRLAQDTGAFSANAGSVVAVYRFGSREQRAVGSR